VDSPCDTCTHRLPGAPPRDSPTLHKILDATAAGCSKHPVSGRVIECAEYEPVTEVTK